MHIVLAVLVAVHALAHMVGFAAPFGYLKNPPPDPALLQRMGLSAAGSKALGVLWLIAMMVFIVAAVGLFRRSDWWPRVMIGACLLSILLTATFLPYAKFGLAVDIALAAFVFANRSYGWVSAST
jgi:hypothetical protein